MILSELKQDKAHWELHLKAAQKDTISNSKACENYLQSKTELPNIKHPAYIHDWLEHPEMRKEIESWPM